MNQLFEVFLFEDTPASDRRPETLYLEEVARCDIYIGLFGTQYGYLDKEGVSPTEREFDRASELGKHRLVFLKKTRKAARDPRMTKLIEKAQSDLVRKSFGDIEDLKCSVSESLSKYWLDLFSGSVPADNERCRTTREAEEVLQLYERAAGQIYELPATLVPFDCVLDGTEISSSEISRLIRETNGNILVNGPSGCGKSHLAANAALDFVRHGGVALAARIKNYTDSLRALLDRESDLFRVPSASKLLSGAQMLERSILLVVDGYNECDRSRQESLTLELAALAGRYKANVLITTQVPLARPEVLEFRTVEVPRAAMATKTAIARNAIDVDLLPAEVELLLDAVNTGLEARLVGEVGQGFDPCGSRFALFDAYARKCLEDKAAEGIRALSHIAGCLIDRLSFSLSVSDLDRLMDRNGVDSEVSRQLQSKGLLSSQGNRISFVHEMFFNAFAAETIVRRASGQSEPILKALNTPLHSERKDFIIGAIDEQLLLENVLAGLSDHDSVRACLSGSCGVRAREWAEANCTRLLSELQEEASKTRFKIENGKHKRVSFDEDYVRTWSLLDQAFLATMPRMIMEGHYLDDIFQIFSILDERINAECLRLHVHRRRHNFSLRSEMFQMSFVFSDGPAPGIARVGAGVGNNILHADRGRLVKFVLNHLTEENMSDGQMYLLLNLARVMNLDHFAAMTNAFAQLIVHTLKTRWSHAPYHLALQLLETAGSCHFASEAERIILIQSLESLLPCENMWLGSSITEALQFLGAFEETELSHRTVVHEEVKRCLAEQEEQTTRELAYRIYSWQFDHPLNGAYFEVLTGLPPHERKHLLTMAAKGAEKEGFFLGILIDELASYGDPKVSEGLTRFIGLPPTNSVFPQKAVDVFVTAHIGLARLGLSLTTNPEFTGSPPTESMAACGAILYWINRTDLGAGTIRSKCAPALSVLNRHRQSATPEVLRLCDPASYFWSERYLKSVNRSIVDYFPEEAVELCRSALSRPQELIGYFGFDKKEATGYAISVLGQYGGIECLPHLRKYCEDRYLGTEAIYAMKRIEERELAQ